MAIDREDASTMELDKEGGTSEKRWPLLKFSMVLNACCTVIDCFVSLLVMALIVDFGCVAGGFSHSNGGGTRNGYNVGEKEQWCLSTLGYVKAFTRQYASEVSC